MTHPALLLLLASTALAQTLEIRGTVVDSTGGPVEYAEVTIGGIDQVNRTIHADQNGVFRAELERPGRYFVGVVKAGYSLVGAPFPQSPVPEFIDISKDRPSVQVRLVLAKLGEITGRVVEDDARTPMAGVPIQVYLRRWSYGRPSLERVGREPVVTDAEGLFRVPNLRPGEYLVSLRPPAIPAAHVLSSFTPEDVSRTDESPADVYWPGGGDTATAAVEVADSRLADVGTVSLRKVRQFRVNVAVAGECPTDRAVRATLLRTGGTAQELGVFPCTGALLRGLDPGDYTLFLASEPVGSGEQLLVGVSGSATFHVADRNGEATVVLRPLVILQGELIVPDGVTAPRPVPGIRVRPLDPATQPRVLSAILWEEDQLHFRIALPPEPVAISVEEFGGSGPYAREIRFNGIPTPGPRVVIQAGVAGQKVEIELADRYSQFGGSVVDGGRAPAVAHLILFPGESGMPDLSYPAFRQVRVVEGKLEPLRVRPGAYRVLAFADGDQAKIHQPGVLERALSAAQVVRLTAGGTENLTVRLTQLR